MLKSRVSENSRFRWFGGLHNVFKMRDLFVQNNDAYMFMDFNIEWRYERACFDSVCDFHRFQAVYHRIMGW